MQSLFPMPKLRTRYRFPNTLVLFSTTLLCCLLLSCTKHQSNSDFKKFFVDENIPARCAVGDIDGDGKNDIFSAVDFESGKEPGLYWYSYPAWIRHRIDGNINFRGDDLEAADINSDGRMDIVATVDDSGRVFWYENPINTPEFKEMDWPKHYLGCAGDYVKDVAIADLNKDGSLEVIIRMKSQLVVFKKNDEKGWQKIELEIYPKEGLDIGDLDQDGDQDIVLNGYWLETPDDLLQGDWKTQVIDEKWFTQKDGGWQDNCSNVLVADISGDRRLDVVLCHSEKKDWPISWYESSGGAEMKWIEHNVTEEFSYCETLSAADIDKDGKLDIIAGEMKKSFFTGDLVIFFNKKSWERKTIAKRIGIYDGVIADIGDDGDYDIIGSQNYDSGPNYFFMNMTSDKLNWKYHAIDDNRTEDQIGKMGLIFPDVNSDGFPDIIAGSFFYRNKNGFDNWKRTRLPGGFDGYFAINIDDDKNQDIIGISDNEIIWIEAKNSEGSKWDSYKVGEVEKGRTQGYVAAQIIPGGKAELIFSRNKNLLMLEIPREQPEKDEWPLVKISDTSEEEGVAVGDIDSDGDIDVACISADGHHIIWLENENIWTGKWKQHIVGLSEKWSDRVMIVDINSDGYPDIVTTEESRDLEYNSRVYWFESPGEINAALWPKHVVTTLRSVNSMDVADFDNDGDIDILVGEHTDQRTENAVDDNLTLLLLNKNNGAVWSPSIIERGKHSSHLGTKFCDIDNDGDLDVVSIGWFQYKYVHLWENISR